MRLHKITEDYIAHKRALGMSFKTRVLRCEPSLVRSATSIFAGRSPAEVLRFCGDATRPGRWRCYYRILRSFYRYALDRVL